MPILLTMHTAYYFSPTDSATSVADFLASCRSFPELAGQHLSNGWFEPWLRDQGRDDLAKRAEKVRGEAEGLQLFLKTARATRRTARRAA